MAGSSQIARAITLGRNRPRTSTRSCSECGPRRQLALDPPSARSAPDPMPASVADQISHVGPAASADRHRGADGAAAVAPVVRQQHRPGRERHLVCQLQRHREDGTGGHHQRSADHPVGVQRPVRPGGCLIQPRAQRRQRQPLGSTARGQGRRRVPGAVIRRVGMRGWAHRRSRIRL